MHSSASSSSSSSSIRRRPQQPASRRRPFGRREERGHARLRRWVQGLPDAARIVQRTVAHDRGQLRRLAAEDRERREPRRHHR